MTAEVEGLRLSGVSLENLLSPELLKKIKESKLELKVINLVFIQDSKNGEGFTPFVLNHQNDKEIKEKILHLNGAKEDELKKLAEIIKEVSK